MPTITGTNLSGNEAYYNDSQANNGNIIVGPITSTTTVWIYDETATSPNCSDEESFVVTVNYTPDIDDIADQTVCDSYSLPTITGTNLSGNEAYYDDSQANNGNIIVGPTTSTTTVWIYDETATSPNCSDEESFVVTVNYTPDIDDIADQTVCDSYSLPTITGTNLSGNEAYYDDSQANNGNIIVGTITSTTTVWIYDETATSPNCSDEESFNVTVNLTPSIDDIADVTVCDSYTLPTITGTNLTGNEAFYDDSQANNGNVITGPITSSMTVWLYDETATNPNCFDEESFNVTVNLTPVLETTLNNVTVTNVNDGVTDVASFSVCDGVSDNIFISANFNDLTGAPNVRVYQTVTVGPNTTFMSWCNNCQAAIGLFTAGISATASLAIPTLPGSVVITFQAWSDANNDGIIDPGECIGDVIEYTIIVNPAPQASVTPDDGEVCAGEDLNMDGNPTEGTIPYSHLWTGSGAVYLDDVTIQNPIFNSPVAGSFSLEYTVTDDNGCSATSQATVFVHEVPTFSFDIAGNSASNINNGVTDPSEMVSVNACNGDTYNIANLIHSDAGNRYMISVTPVGGTLLFDGNPATNGDISAAQFNGAVGSHTLALANPAIGGSLIQVITPYNDVNNSGTFDTGDCAGDPITISYTAYPIPNINDIADVTVCDSYTLPIITGTNLTGNEAFYDDSQANNGNVILGPITSSMTVWMYDETATSPNCFDEESIVVTVNLTPVIDDIADVTVCDSYTLPTITGTNLTGNEAFYDDSQANNGNVILGPITSSMTVWMYDENATNPVCSDEESFTVTVNYTPVADAPSDVTECDSYTLPALTVGNYFTGPGGTGTALFAGNNITSTQTIYVYAETGTTPNCTDENSFDVIINLTPVADAPSDVTECDSYTLPALTVGNYFTGTGGTGTALFAGNNITSTQTIYVYAETGTTPNCTDENSFVVTINITPVADAPSDVTECDSYTLPALTVGNYFTGPGGTGTALFAENNITSTQTIYVYAETGTTPNCTDENSFDVTINITPVADAPSDVTECDSYTLPALTVGNYFTGPGGTGTALFAGNNITSTQTIYVYAETATTPNCTDENSFVVTINITPVADAPSDVTECDSYTLPALTVGNYFTGPGGTGTALFAGNNITSTQTIYVYAETGTTPNCTDENSFDVTINITPVADAPSDVTECDSYTLPALTVGNYFTGPGGTGTALFAGNNITSTQTINVYAETATTPNCTDENNFVVTILNTPVLVTTLNGISVTNINDGVTDEASFSVCDGVSDNIFISADFSDLAGVPNVHIYQTVNAGLNTNFSPWCNNCQDILGAFTVANVATASLIDPSQPGSVVVTFQAWRDDNNNNSIDIGECIGDIIEYTILVNPAPQASVTPDDGEVCAGEDLNMDGNPTGGTTPYSHSWTGSGAVHLDDATIQTPIFNSTIAGSFSLEYTVTDDNGCSVTSQATVLVHEVPTFSFDITGNAAANINNDIIDPSEVAAVTVCDGESYTVSNLIHSDPNNRYMVSVTPVGGALLFDGSPAIYGDISAVQFNGAQGSHTITLVNPVLGGSLIQVITPYNDVNNSGSFDVGDCAGDPITITYSVTPAEFAVITSQPQNAYVCEGQNATLNVTATGPGLYYQWQILTGLTYVDIPGANTTSYTVNNVTVSGEWYRMIVYANYGLACQTEITSDPVQVIIGGNNGIVCNDLVQVSVDDICQATITPDMMLEGSYNHNMFTVLVLNANYEPLGNVVDASFINKTWTVKVFDNCTGNSCWGKIFVEDKLPPIITCRPDTLVNCYDIIDFTKAPFLPVALDNCEGNVPVQVIYDVTSPENCVSDTIAKRVIRYRAKDSSNNVSNICERTIYYLKVKINNILIPKSYDGVPGNNAPLSCDYNWETGIKNKYPDPSETGRPYFPGGNPFTNAITEHGLCKIQTTFADDSITVCIGTYKVIRKWSILNWCTGQLRTEFQIIKIIDDEGPTAVIPIPPGISVAACSPNPNIKVSALIDSDPHACSGSWLASEPINISDCAGKANVTYTVQFLLADAFGNPPQNEQYYYQFGNTKSEKITSGPNAGRWFITGLPIGCIWLKYTLTDPCGNSTNLYTEVRVMDRTAPVAVCDEYTVVTLSAADGTARVYAKTFDDGSHDNCSAVTLEVRRMTPGCGQSTVVWSDYVDVCCDNVGKTIQVELKVTDSSGNTNICMVNVETKDKIQPLLTCPNDITVNCGSDTSAVATGKPVLLSSSTTGAYYSDNCSGAILTWTNSGSLNNCGEGIIFRTYKVTDKAGNTKTCVQQITVRSTNPYNGPSWASVPHREVEGCINEATDPSKTGKPDLSNTACSHVAAAYLDQLFPNVEGVCYKIFRKWTVIDWCKFRVEGEPATYIWPSVPTEGINKWSYTQVIKVVDHTKPVITKNNEGKIFQVTGSNCGGVIELTESASDCSPSATLAIKWSYIVRRGSANYKTGSGTGGTLNAGGNYESGTYEITWKAEDQCGNIETITYTFTVRDNKRPTPYCLSSISTVIMPSVGTVSIRAKTFDKGSFDNCQGALVFSFSDYYPLALPDSIRTFTCSDFPEGKDTIHITLRMYVWDQQKNGDFCTVNVIIQKNVTCNFAGKPLTIGGSIGTVSNTMMNTVSVYLKEESALEIKTKITDTKGEFVFNQMSPTGNYFIKPEKDDNHLNGVSTLDLVLIQQHILGLRPFTSPYQYLAADINNDTKVSASDLVELRKLILGYYYKLPKNTSWRFYEKSQQIPDPNFPWGLNESIQCFNKTGDQLNNHFVAVKIGDINISAQANTLTNSTQQRTSSGFLVINDKKFSSDNSVFVPVYAQNIESMGGIQGAFDFDKNSLRFKQITSGVLNVTNENYRSYQEDGRILFSWNVSENGVSVADQVLFTLEFESIANGQISDVLSLVSDKINCEYYNIDMTEYDLRLTYKHQIEDDLMEVSQNTPNPFTSQTIIPVSISENGLVKVKIHDNTGKVVLFKSEYFTKGRNEFIIHANDLLTSGIYYYEIMYNDQLIKKKMIKIND
ncbi:MAG: T9SS type A sorting domain-containing protein [Saprospiraceae bacterium]|nr:T9SS type A sorting domain-containing protein [Saprospiraceae bacterium]